MGQVVKERAPLLHLFLQPSVHVGQGSQKATNLPLLVGEVVGVEEEEEVR